MSDVRSLCRSFLDEATQADWSNAELNSLINAKYHEVRTMAVTAFEDYYLTTTTFNSVADQEEYGSSDSAPTDVFKIRRVELNYDVSNADGAPTRCFPIHNIDEVRRDLGYVNSGLSNITTNGANYYTYGFRSNFKIGFIPKPDKTGTNAIKIWYVTEAADLSSDSSDINIPYADKNYILLVYGATADALRFGQQAVGEAQDFDVKYQTGMAKYQEELEDKVSEEAKMIVDTSPIII